MHGLLKGFGVIVLGATLGCGGGSTGPSSGTNNPGNPGTPGSGGATSGTTITVGNNSYSPDALTVPVGTTVTWKWDSCSGDGYGGMSCTEHTVTFNDGQASPTQSSGSFSRAFTAAGTYSYHCAIHGSYMAGTITVR